MDVPISGRCDRRFALVREEFARNFAERGELGGAVCVVVEGVTVVHLAGGWADAARRKPWRHDTVVDFYSVGKAFVALLALQLVDRGLIELDDPLATVWPEYGACGKEATTLRQALCHRAGVPAIRAPLTNEDLWDWGRMAAALAATEPWWEPGARHAYHTNTYGHLVGEIVRRVGGEMPGAALAAVARPLEADVHVGVPPSAGARCAEVVFHAPDPASSAETLDFGALEADARMEMLSYFNPPGYSSMGVVNSPEWRAAEVPSTNGHGSAAGVARVYAALLEPGRLLSPDVAGRGHGPAVEWVLPHSARGRHVRARLQADGAAATLRSQPAQFRTLRHGGCSRVRRSRLRRGVRVRDERRDPSLAEHPQSRPDGRGLQRALGAAPSREAHALTCLVHGGRPARRARRGW